MKSPLATVKEKFGDKAKLIAAVEQYVNDDLWVGRTNKDKGLSHVSNAKLLRLHETFAAVKEKFGTRAKLIDAILDLEKRSKDDGYRARLTAYPVPRLWDAYRALERRARAASKGPKTKKASPVAKPPVKKAAAKKAPSKKTSAKKKA